MSDTHVTKVLFVCLGNICRSPMAELVMHYLVNQKESQLGNHRFVIDSAGTAGYHVGDSPDDRSVGTCKKLMGDAFPRIKQVGRKISKDDFHTFDYILCMDDSNLSDLKRIQPNKSKAVVNKLCVYDPEGTQEISDPYYGGMNGFQVNYKQVMRSCEAFIQSVVKK